jgi:hypothetical protein
MLVAGLPVVVAAIAASVGLPLLSSASALEPSSPPGRSSPAAASTTETLHIAHRGALGQADGVLPTGTTVFHDGLPGLAKLDPALLDALRRASTDAEDEGVRILVASGWRSRKYQDQLFRQAVVTYGSSAKAARWVAIPGTSSHESGDAVDIGHADATAWLAEHGARYGLCQIYGNEPWHYELRPAAINRGCPRTYADPTHDRTMQW